jgi:hypothetical protein
MYGRKSQIEFTDFVVAIIIFSFVLISYYIYTTNISKQDSVETSNLISDAKTISESLTSGGFPENWKSSDVVRIGFIGSDNRLDTEKFNEFIKIDYNESKRLLGTAYEHFLFFVNESEDIQNVEGVCGAGYPAINISYDISAAYYYQGPGQEECLKALMEGPFKADVYYDKSKGATVGVNDQSAFRNNINNYDFVVVEHPYWSNNDFNAFVSVANPWVRLGGILFVGGELGASANSYGFDVIFKKLAGASKTQRTATVVVEDPYVSFNVDDEVVFEQFYYIENNGANPVTIAIFKEEGNKVGLARWDVDEGKILFFSDFKAEYLAGDFQNVLEGSAKKWANAMCLPINISNIERGDLVKVDRLLIYKSDVLKMVIYVWT